MFLHIANIAILSLVGLVAWWLTWYDPKVMGVNDRNDLLRRGLRCGVTLLLGEEAIWSLWQFTLFENRAAGEAYLVIALVLAVLWSSCVSALLARAFHWLFHPDNHLEFELDRSMRDLDTLGRLVRNGRKKEAIQLCVKLKKSGDASVLALETILEHLGVPQNFVRKPEPLTEASRLRREGKFGEAEALLKSLLSRNPEHVDAGLMLIRLYAQELHQPDKAEKVLRALERRPHVPRGHTDFARRSIPEWGLGTPKLEEEPALPESMEELLAHRHFGTAVERLEQKIQDQPGDFDSWLKLAEVYAEHCDNVSRADAIVQQITDHAIFSPEQIQTAKARLVKWREAEAERSARE